MRSPIEDAGLTEQLAEQESGVLAVSKRKQKDRPKAVFASAVLFRSLLLHGAAGRGSIVLLLRRASRTAALSARVFGAFPRCEGNGLNLVSIGISDKGAIIVSVVVFTKTGRSLVSGTIRNSAFVNRLTVCRSGA